MGNIFSCKCDTCLISKEQEIKDTKSSKIIKFSQKNLEENKILKKDLSTSFEDSIKRTPSNNNIIPILNSLMSEKFYSKLISGESFHNLLEFLYSYNNKILFNILQVFLIKIKNILNDTLCIEYSIKNLQNNFLIIYNDLNNNNILDDIKENMEEDSRIKYYLIDVIESCTEIYHFFWKKIFGKKNNYLVFYWDKYKNYYDYIEQKIKDIKNCISNINLSLGVNKLKIID